jgi:hypothetical protein
MQRFPHLLLDFIKQASNVLLPAHTEANDFGKKTVLSSLEEHLHSVV